LTFKEVKKPVEETKQILKNLKYKGVGRYFPPKNNLTAASANPKVYHKAPRTFPKCGAFSGGLADTFLDVGSNVQFPTM